MAMKVAVNSTMLIIRPPASPASPMDPPTCHCQVLNSLSHSICMASWSLSYHLLVLWSASQTMTCIARPLLTCPSKTTRFDDKKERVCPFLTDPNSSDLKTGAFHLSLEDVTHQ
ncbi:hypothetical protein ACIGBH_39525 [Streptomyces sp. NPDC085929]|uniref:hypothetical protein n=1 Tax=Streptomyces sp. NPDC085929 TaxID=3365739 RepID=UPI0037D0AEAB